MAIGFMGRPATPQTLSASLVPIKPMNDVPMDEKNKSERREEL
jgi:hypothetical protein